MRKGLAQRGFALKSETLCRAAGRLYTVINAQYTGRAAEPTGLVVAGKDAPTFGEAKNSWLTGTAAWTFVSISQAILGVQPELDQPFQLRKEV